jgi:quercetin dioxygenase-like cupin family protein
MIKVFNEDPVMKRQDLKVKFPAGYVEPAHMHKNWHALVVLKGRMCVDGKDLRPGDYFFGFDTVHGPLEYPDGCEVFVVTMGDSIEHEWDEEDYAAHERQWEAETDEGKQAIAGKPKE